MLTLKLQETLNKTWENCWPVSDLRPIALLDLISYLFFIKKADDLDLIHQVIKNPGHEIFICPPEIEEFSWSKLQNQNARDIHHLFSKENGLFELMSHYSKTKSSYSEYFKAPLLIEPTPKLLFSAIEIINIIETNNQATREQIVEYLFQKNIVNAKKNLPEPILNLIISIADPALDDIIFDPAAGNGTLLLGAFKYIHAKDDSSVTRDASPISEIKIKGYEPDVVHLRIAAMNFNIHGLVESDFSLSSFQQIEKKNSTLIISSLSGLDNTEPASEISANSLAEKESALLNDIIERLSENGRSVVLVGQDLLQSGEPECINTRKKLIEQNNLEGVITLSASNDSFYSGAAILVFDKSKSSSENTWFYKWRNAKKKNKDLSLRDENKQSDFEEVSHILEKWETRHDATSFSSANSFFISADYLRSNNYNLNFNDYKLIKQQPTENENEIPVEKKMESVLAAKKENLHEFFDSSTPLPFEKQKRKLSPVLLIALILICAAFAAYWVYSKNTKKYFSKNSIERGSDVSINNNFETSKIESPSNEFVSIKNTSANEASTNSLPDSKKYAVINKTWFHYEPDSNKIKPLYLTPRKDLVVISKEEENGFIYVVYINNKGESTHGWLDKKDLQPVE